MPATSDPVPGSVIASDPMSSPASVGRNPRLSEVRGRGDVRAGDARGEQRADQPAGTPGVVQLLDDLHHGDDAAAALTSLAHRRTVGVGRMTAYLFVTLGSWGDLFPYLGIAEELQARGHRVTVAASPAWQTAVNDTEITFLPIGNDVGFKEFENNPQIFRPMPFGLRAALDTFLFAQADQLTADLRPAMAQADVVVAHPAHVVAQNLAEALDKPVVIASVFPAMIPSAHTVPGGSITRARQGRLGRAANRTAWASARFFMSRLFDRQTNRHRQTLDLPRVKASLLTLPMRADKILLLCPSELIDPPPDWPLRVTVTGSVTWDNAAGPIDHELQAFLDGGDKPVLVTLGASSSAVAEDFFDLAATALGNLGQRQILVTGPATPPQRELGPNAIVREFVSFDAVLPSCRAIIHHGGVGTAISAARAGIPQVAVPRGFDQPDTAAMLERHRIGKAVPWKRRHRRLQDAIARVLDDPTLASNASAIGSAIRNTNGAACAADQLERLPNLSTK